jgi:oligopeptide/dipeptide ABC transporter ATP-binding protein
MQEAEGTSVLFITHDLGVVAQISDEVAVMYLGQVVEQGSVREVLKDPMHPYTAALLKSLPSMEAAGARLPAIKGSVPSLKAIPPGCPFHPRCPHAVAGVCDHGGRPPLENLEGSRKVACVRAAEIRGQLNQVMESKS